MQRLQISTHSAGKTYRQPHFFILNKGLNSGKLLKQSCPNCFVLLADDEKQMDFYYWLFYGLWRAKSFHPIHKGSVIIFVTLNDLKSIIYEASAKAKEDGLMFEQSIAKLKKLEELENLYLNNLKLINEAKRIVFYRYNKAVINKGLNALISTSFPILVIGKAPIYNFERKRKASQTARPSAF